MAAITLVSEARYCFDQRSIRPAVIAEPDLLRIELVKLGKRHDLRLVDGAAFGRRASRQCRVPEDPALDHRHDVERGADHAVVHAEGVRAGDGKALLVERGDHPEFPVDGMRRRQQLAERLAAQNV
jgi:hypothetical protein